MPIRSAERTAGLTLAEFAYNTAALGPARAARAVRGTASRSGRRAPALTPADVLDYLQQRYAMTDAVALLRETLETGSARRTLAAPDHALLQDDVVSGVVAGAAVFA